MSERAAEIETSTIVQRNLDSWNESTIEARNRWIANKAIEVWSI